MKRLNIMPNLNKLRVSEIPWFLLCVCVCAVVLRNGVTARTHLQGLSCFISSRRLLQRAVFTINFLGEALISGNKKVVDGNSTLDLYNFRLCFPLLDRESLGKIKNRIHKIPTYSGKNVGVWVENFFQNGRH